MDIDFMRNVDYYAGRPICAVLSGVNALGKAFSDESRDRPIKKILFIQISEMGSAVIVNGAVQRAKELFPEAEIHYLMFKEMASILDILGEVPKENIHTISSKSFGELTSSTLSVLGKLRRMDFDAAIDLELFSRISNILSYLSGARLRVGFHRFHNEGLYRGNMQTHKVQYNPHQHIGVNFLSLVQALKQSQGEVPMVKKMLDLSMLKLRKIRSSEGEKKLIMEKLQKENSDINEKSKIIILNPNASLMLPIRKWPLDNYKELAKRLLANKKVFLVITGTSEEKGDADEIERFVNDKRCVNFAGKTSSIKELIDLYNISDFMVTNDSGPGHFATLTDMKTIVLFGPETPRLYGPLGKNIISLYSNFACSPCVSAYNSRKTPCRDSKCLQAISVDAVYSRIKKELKL